MDADVLFGVEIHLEGVFFVHDFDEVVHVRFVGIFYAKVVDY